MKPNMTRLFVRSRERNVKFNKTKVQFKVPNVTYMGHIVAADGLKPDPAKGHDAQAREQV